MPTCRQATFWECCAAATYSWSAVAGAAFVARFAVLQQLSISFAVSIAAKLLGLVTLDSSPLTPEKFQTVFLMMSVVPLLGLPGFLQLRPEDGAQVSGRRKKSEEHA
ncbi:hypothetical protein [Rhizobium leguminosarum]|uniref:hypothetical protein n=1 Tax=Rhizobium leguminosarum TaxID=384 RepID=UPI003F9CF7F4